MPKKFYVQNKSCGYWGNNIVWWGLEGQGYTAHVQNAERFDEEKAVRLVREDPEKWEMYACDEIDRRLQLVFDMQDLARLKEDPAGAPNPWGANRTYAITPHQGDQS